MKVSPEICAHGRRNEIWEYADGINLPVLKRFIGENFILWTFCTLQGASHVLFLKFFGILQRRGVAYGDDCPRQ